MIGRISNRQARLASRRALLVLAVVGTVGWTGASPRAASPRLQDTTYRSVAALDAYTPDEAPGGWRPKRPMLCAAAVVATAVAGGLMSTVPGGGLVAFVAMAPLLLDACG